jgi:low affinity Fe/Cu permease
VTQLKLDELIRAVRHARNRFVAMEEMSDEELERLERQFHELHHEASELRRHRASRRHQRPAEG